MTTARGDRVLFMRNSRDIERVKRSGRRVVTAYFNMLVCPSDTPHTRIGIIVGKRFGGAVSRNRVKRLFRELARQLRPRLAQGQDCVIFPKREALARPFSELQGVWIAVLKRQRLLSLEVGQ